MPREPPLTHDLGGHETEAQIGQSEGVPVAMIRLAPKRSARKPPSIAPASPKTPRTPLHVARGHLFPAEFLCQQNREIAPKRDPMKSVRPMTPATMVDRSEKALPRRLKRIIMEVETTLAD